MIRTKSAYPTKYQPWGGFMPFPPQECPKHDRTFLDHSSGIRWIDNFFCSANRCGQAPCNRRKLYAANNYAELKAETARLSKLRKGATDLVTPEWDISDDILMTRN